MGTKLLYLGFFALEFGKTTDMCGINTVEFIKCKVSCETKKLSWGRKLPYICILKLKFDLGTKLLYLSFIGLKFRKTIDICGLALLNLPNAKFHVKQQEIELGTKVALLLYF